MSAADAADAAESEKLWDARRAMNGARAEGVRKRLRRRRRQQQEQRRTARSEVRDARSRLPASGLEAALEVGSPLQLSRPKIEISFSVSICRRVGCKQTVTVTADPSL